MYQPANRMFGADATEVLEHGSPSQRAVAKEMRRSQQVHR